MNILCNLPFHKFDRVTNDFITSLGIIQDCSDELYLHIAKLCAKLKAQDDVSEIDAFINYINNKLMRDLRIRVTRVNEIQSAFVQAIYKRLIRLSVD